MTTLTALWIVLALILTMIGMFGLFSPALPGLPLLFTAAWLVAYAGDFHYISNTTLIVLAIITAFGMALDFIAGLIGAKTTGASKKALWGAFWGGVIGILFGLAGMIIGPLIGAAVGEWWQKRNLVSAGKVSIGTFIGILVGVVVKIGCALSMVSIVIFSHLFVLTAS